MLRDAPHQHLRHNVLQDVGVAVATVLGEAVFGVDVVRDHYLVLVALLREERQAGQRNEKNEGGLNTTQLTILVKEHAVIALMCCHTCLLCVRTKQF